MKKYLLLWILCISATVSFADRSNTVTVVTTFPSGDVTYKALGVHNRMDVGVTEQEPTMIIGSNALNVGNPSTQSSGQTVISSSVGLVNVKTLKGTGKAELGSSVTGTGVAQAAFGQLEASIDKGCSGNNRCAGTPGLGAKTLEVLGNSKVLLYGKDLMAGCTEGANWQKIGSYYYLVCGGTPDPVPECEKSEAYCQTLGKHFDAENCDCVSGGEPGGCGEMTCPANKHLTDACECVCNNGYTEGYCQGAQGGKHLDPVTCQCVDNPCASASCTYPAYPDPNQGCACSLDGVCKVKIEEERRDDVTFYVANESGWIGAARVRRECGGSSITVNGVTDYTTPTGLVPCSLYKDYSGAACPVALKSAFVSGPPYLNFYDYNTGCRQVDCAVWTGAAATGFPRDHTQNNYLGGWRLSNDNNYATVRCEWKHRYCHAGDL